MAVEFTSLGGHRLPVRRYEGFSHIPEAIVEEGAGVAGLNSTQSAALARVTSRSESLVAADLQSASLVGESVPDVGSRLGPHRLPLRRYEAFDHGAVPTGVRAETAIAADAVSAVGTQGVVVSETASIADSVIAQTVIPVSIDDVLTAADAVESGLSRAGALVSTVGPMGMPRQRWVDFIHPAGVEEIVNFADTQDAAIPGEMVAFVSDVSSLVDTVDIGGIFQVDVADAIALSDSVTTSNTFSGVMNETAPIFDVADAAIEELSGTVNEINGLVDILVVDSIFRNAAINEFAFLQDIPGVAGELYETVAETVSATAVFDISGAFTPGVNLDGARTIHVEAELREIEVRELEVMA